MCQCGRVMGERGGECRKADLCRQTVEGFGDWRRSQRRARCGVPGEVCPGHTPPGLLGERSWGPEVAPSAVWRPARRGCNNPAGNESARGSKNALEFGGLPFLLWTIISGPTGETRAATPQKSSRATSQKVLCQTSASGETGI